MAKAAERLYVSRAALSQNLKRLESELGCNLFARGHNKLEITSYGKLLFERVRSISAQIEGVYQDIEDERARRERLVRIGHFAMPMCYFKMPHLAMSLPDHSISVEVGDPDRLVEELVLGNYDLIIVSSKTLLPENMQTLLLETERACLSIPPESALYGRETVALAELKGETLLITSDMAGYSEWYRDMATLSGASSYDIEEVPPERYLSTMSDSERCHFSTVQMVGFFGLGNGRLAALIEDPQARRDIIAAYAPGKRARLSDLLAALANGKSERFETYDIFPYLVFPGMVDNLSISHQLR